jgi:hypothetical protein
MTEKGYYRFRESDFVGLGHGTFHPLEKSEKELER